MIVNMTVDKILHIASMLRYSRANTAAKEDIMWDKSDEGVPW
jgi:hypothetical protein